MLDLWPDTVGNDSPYTFPTPRVTTVRGSGDRDDVAASVFSSVLNASSILDVDHAGDGRLFHFLKTNEESFSADLAEMRRLSGAYNVTTGDGARGRGRKICASRGDSAKVSNVVVFF